MPNIFSYGSLQQAEVQLATFGRLLEGHTDALPRFARTIVTNGHAQYANVVRNDRDDSHVDGTVFEVTEKELEHADAYEQLAEYARKAVILASGKSAWVYADSRDVA